MKFCSSCVAPICDFCKHCIHTEELTTPVGCKIHPELFSESGYCDDFYCFKADIEEE